MPASLTLLAIAILLALTKPTRFTGLVMLTLLALVYSTIFFVVLIIGVVVYFFFFKPSTSN
jgi:hypothetical protein